MNDPEGFAIEKVGEGTLSISNDCVTLVQEDGNSILLVWPEPSEWNGGGKYIHFLNPDASVNLRLRDGDRIAPEGRKATSSTPYVIGPKASCVA